MLSRSRKVALFAAIATMAQLASGYYTWTFFPTRNAPGIPARFDLSALPGKTVSYFISEQGPSKFMPGDNFAKLISQIQAAASTWNNVASSDLRVAFGGLSSVGSATQSLPGIDVVFDDDMPPGLEAYTRPVFGANANGFVPIQRAAIHLRSDLTVKQQASYTDSYFLTVVHEFGHALGLQHSLSSGVMSTWTRATTKARPLSDDDVAGLAFLYPAAGFSDATGAITGRVAQSGTGVNMASVVALSTTTGKAVSALTNPDGTFRIAGVTPGQYYVYAHPLPLALGSEAGPADIVPPTDERGTAIPANTGFSTRFFPGTTDWKQATVISVNAGASTDNINFAADRRTAPAFSTVFTYGFQGDVAVPAPSLSQAAYLLFYSPEAQSNGKLASGLGVSIVGAAAGLRQDTLAVHQASYTRVVVDPAQVSSALPAALALTLNNDLYVLPAAFTMVPSGPPSVTSVSGDSNAITVNGTNFSADSRVMFDGVAAKVVRADKGSLVVTPPVATANYMASIAVLSSDGQSSTQGLGQVSAPVYLFQSGGVNPVFGLNNPSLVAGTDTWVEISGYGDLSFVDGQVSVGFGSSDITVRKIWVVNSSVMRLNLSIATGAQPGPVKVTVASGLQVVTLSSTQIVAPTRQPSMMVPVYNQATGLAGVPAGGTAVVNMNSLPSSLSGWTVTVGDTTADYKLLDNGQLAIQVPSAAQSGTVPVKLRNPSGDTVSTVLVQIDPPPPTILSISSILGGTIDGNNPAHAGDIVSLKVAGLTDQQGNIVSGIRVVAGGVTSTPHATFTTDGNVNLDVALSSNLQPGSVSLFVQVDTRISIPVVISVR